MTADSWASLEAITVKKANIFLGTMLRDLPKDITSKKVKEFEEAGSPLEQKLVSSPELVMQWDQDSGKNVIKSVSIDKLVELLLSGLGEDFDKIFFSSFRKWCKPSELFGKLIVSYCCTPSSEIDSENFVNFDCLSQAGKDNMTPRRVK